MTTPKITSRWPIIHTNPAGAVEAGGMAILTAIAAVLVLGPLLGAGVTYIVGPLVPDVAWANTLRTIGVMLSVSFVLSWIALIAAVPIAALCAAHGLAGWGVALFGGVVAGTFATLILDGALTPDVWGPFTATAVILALICWTTVRAFHPAFIGIATNTAAQE